MSYTNKLRSLLLVSFLLVGGLLAGYAQYTPIVKYQYAPSAYQNVFLDYVANNVASIINTYSGQYVGQVDSKGLLCGYGMFVNNDGSTIMGQFNQGKLLFGIKMSSQNAMVGDDENYANYSLTTGHLDYILRGSDRQVVDGEKLYDYAFVSMRYQNGDQYVGELYQRKRHGYGIYYYANGDIWYGEYKNDVRSGYGCLFDRNGEMTIGMWEGEDLRRCIFVRTDKKLKKKK